MTILKKVTWLLALSLLTSGCATRVNVIAGAGPPRPSYEGSVALKFIDVPPSAIELARVTVTTLKPDLIDAVEALLARTARLGGNLAKLDQVQSDTESVAALDSNGKLDSEARRTYILRGRAFYLPESGERAR